MLGNNVFYYNIIKKYIVAFGSLFNDIHVYDAEIYHQVGDIIPKVRSSLDRSGHVIVIGSTPQEAICKADKIIEEVKFITV